MANRIGQSPTQRTNHSRRHAALLLFVTALLLGAGAAFAGVAPLVAQDVEPTTVAGEEGYYYTVRSGDSWGLVKQ